MTAPRNGNPETSTTLSAEAAAEGEGLARTAKRAWRTPQLRHLGSIRELTLGATMGKAEGGGTFKPGM